MTFGPRMAGHNAKRGSNRRPGLLDEIMRRVRAVRDAAPNDPERAHSLERSLWEWVLERIAEGECNGNIVKACALEALQTREVKFPRRVA